MNSPTDLEILTAVGLAARRAGLDTTKPHEVVGAVGPTLLDIVRSVYSQMDREGRLWLASLLHGIGDLTEREALLEVGESRPKTD